MFIKETILTKLYTIILNIRDTAYGELKKAFVSISRFSDFTRTEGVQMCTQLCDVGVRFPRAHYAAPMLHSIEFFPGGRAFF